ncbi:MAG: cyclic pyranopterin monophosphate synthase accessory protein [Acidimicrobiia bacterium]|nr:MAG: cyclic pyranopterin monophosphate synthase accessory protein [Acidimicrobiia bacterium]
MAEGMSHLDPQGRIRMVDTSGKEVTSRSATAQAKVALSPETAELLFGGGLEKGDALAAVRIAGVMAAKRTPDLIPLCHPLMIDAVEVQVEQAPPGAVITATVRSTGRTGVEMEAMTAASVAALTLYDMVKGVERGVTIDWIGLIRKEGGRSGVWERRLSGGDRLR